MNELRFEAEIVRGEAAPVAVVTERQYGGVRVTADWPRDVGAPELRVALTVHGDVDRRDAPGYVELFFHDVYLILNLASPGAFDGTVSVSGSELRVRELTFHLAAFGWAAADRVEQLPVEEVTRWYDSLQLGTSQLASDATAVALFELLHLARTQEEEETSVLRLARAAEALLGRAEALRPLFALREELAAGRTPVFHPMHEDALDPRVTDATAEWVETLDNAATAVVAELQRRVSDGNR